MKVSNLCDREHIQANKHSLQSLSVLTTKTLLTVDHLLDTVHEFIKGEISVQSKREQHNDVKRKGKKLYCTQDYIWQPIREPLSYPHYR